MNTQINIYIVLTILLIHWCADFVKQTDWQAKNKSSNNKALLEHTINYSFWWFLFGSFYGIIIHKFWFGLEFSIITFIFHTITDYYTSRINTRLYNENKIHEFFVNVGIDQYYHYIQLLLTYQLLMN